MAQKFYNSIDMQSQKILNLTAGTATGDAVEFDQMNTALALKSTVTDLSSVANAAGASLIGIEDSNARFTATTVEAALQEVKAVADQNSLGLGAFWAEVATHSMAGDGNITLSGEQTIDGVLTSASRVLVTDQTDASENGIYVSAAGAWARSADADAAGEFTVNKTVFVSGGTMGAGHTMAYVGADSPTLETDDLDFDTKSETVIADGAITAAKLATDAVTTVKIVDAAVTSDKIGIDAVNSTHIADNAIGAFHISNTSVTEEKLNSDIDADSFLLSGYVRGGFATEVVSTDKVLGAIQKLAGDVEVGLPALIGNTFGLTHLGTYTGSTITDNVGVKIALQELETALEATDTAGRFTVAASIAGSGGTQTVNHALNTAALVIQVWNGTELASVQADYVDANNTLLTNDSGNTVTGTVAVLSAA